MTFFTEDTCYNLALVTVLALVALYLIGKFFTEEEFAIQTYYYNIDRKNFNDCQKSGGRVLNTSIGTPFQCTIKTR